MAWNFKFGLGKKKAKRTWTTPVLTVAVRGKPEERVLVTCKVSSPQVAAQIGLDLTCSLGRSMSGPAVPCADTCDSTVGS